MYLNYKRFETLNMWMVKLYLFIIITGVSNDFLIYTQAVIKTQNHIFSSKRFMLVLEFDFSLLEERV